MKVSVLDATSGEKVFTCDGPDEHGGCARAPGCAVVPCSGQVLRTQAGPGSLDGFAFHVSDVSAGCPLRVLVPDY